MLTIEFWSKQGMSLPGDMQFYTLGWSFATEERIHPLRLCSGSGLVDGPWFMVIKHSFTILGKRFLHFRHYFITFCKTSDSWLHFWAFHNIVRLCSGSGLVDGPWFMVIKHSFTILGKRFLHFRQYFITFCKTSDSWLHFWAFHNILQYPWFTALREL